MLYEHMFGAIMELFPVSTLLKSIKKNIGVILGGFILEEYHETQEYVSKKEFEKVVKENHSLKKECTFLRNQIIEIHIYCQNVIKLFK